MAGWNNLSYYAQVVAGNELWISNIRFNGLFRINIESGENTFVGRFPRYASWNEELHLFAEKYGDKIYFFPKKGKSIDIYDLTTGAFSSVICRTDSRNGFVTAVDAFRTDEDTVFAVPCYSNMPLQEFSIKKEVVIDRVWLEKAGRYVEDETEPMILYACKMQDEIFYPIHGTNKVGSYNFKEKKEKIYVLKELKRIMGDITFDGCELWLNADQGIYQWNPHKGSLRRICGCASEKEGWIEQFVIVDQNIIGIPRWLDTIKIIDRKTLKQREIHIDKSALNKNANMPWRDVREGFVWKGRLIISPVKYKEAICMELNSGEVLYKEYKISSLLPKKEYFLIREKEEKDLQDYLAGIQKSASLSYKTDPCCIGRSIFQKVE